MKNDNFNTESGRPLSRVWFGGWQASGWTTSNESNFVEALERYLSLGGNALDTAEGYGNGLSEKLIGNTLASKKREEIFVATKFHHYRTSLSQIERALDRSLKNLQLDYVDLLYQHWPAKERVSKKVIEALVFLREKGKVRNIGVSNWDREVFRELSDQSPVDVVQNCYNLLWRSDESWFPKLQRSGRPHYLAYSPLAQGLLAGRGEMLENLPKDHRAKNVLFSQTEAKKNLLRLEELRSWSAELQVSPSTLSLAWILSKPFVSGVIVGASNPHQVEENIQAITFPHTQAFERLDQLFSLRQEMEITSKSMWGWHPRSG